jgi:predicted membrane protein
MSTEDVIPRDRPQRPFKDVPVTPQLAVGLLIMLIGLALLLDRFGWVNAGFVFRLWPVVLIVFGAMHFTRGAREHRFWGFFWIFTGTWFLLRSLNLITLGFWELFLPILLIAFGVSLVMRTLADSGYVKPSKDVSPHLFAVWSESKQRFDGKPFEGAYMTAVMGSCDLDLRRATMQPGEERTVVVFAMMAGLVIRVPPEWHVVVKVVPIMGGVDDKRVPPVTPPPPLPPGPPRLVIRGTVLMAGMELKD